MKTLQSIQTRIDRTHDLQAVVTTMKSLAAVSIRQYQDAAESLNRYMETLRLGFQILLRGAGPPHAAEAAPGRPACLVIGSDQGMCGNFNDAIAERALAAMQQEKPLSEWSVVAVGERAAGRLQDGGAALEDVFEVPGSLARVTALVQRLLWHVQSRYTEHEVGRVRVFHNRHVGGASYEPDAFQLIPPDRDWFRELAREAWPTRMLPLFTLPREQMTVALTRQFLFVTLHRAVVHSLAAENASRLAAMQNAEKNIEEMLDDLQRDFHQRRQSSITAELQDIVVGSKAAA